MSILTPEHAKELVNGFDSLPEGERPRAAALLREYAAKRAETGLGAFQTPPGVSRDRRKRFEALYADSAGLAGVLPESERRSFEDAAANTLDPEEAKLRAVNQAWFAETQPDMADVAFKNWPAVRSSWAKAAFGVDKPEVGEEELFGLVGKRMAEDKARDEFLASAFADLQLEASKGGTFVDAWRKVGQGMAGKPGWSPEAHDKYREAGLRVFNEVNEALAPLRPVIDLGRTFYALAAQGEVQKDGQSNLGDIQAARTAFVEALGRLDAKQREQALAFAIAGVEAPKRMDEGGEAGGVEKAAVQLERAIGGFGGNVARIAKQVGEKAASNWYFRGVQSGDYERRELERLVDEGLTDAVDPIKSKSRVVQGVYDAIDSLPYMATAIIPYAGIPLTLAAMAEDNRQKFVANGVGKDEALGLAMLAAAPQVAIERLQANLVFKGKMPGFEKWLAKPVTTKMELARKIAVVGGLNVVIENVEEAAQDITPPVFQSIASTLSEDIPEVDWNRELADYAKGRVDTFFALLPLALVGTGTASFKEAAYGRAYLSDMKILRAAGFKEEVADQIAKAETVQQKEAMLQAEWVKMREAAKVESDAAAGDVAALAEANAQAQSDAFAELDADMRASFAEQAGPVVGAAAVAQEDGSWAVLDKEGGLVDVAFSPEAAMALVDEVNRADDLDLSAAVADMVDWFQTTNEPGQTIEVRDERRTLADKVEDGEITPDEAQRAVDVAIALGNLDAGATVETVSIDGENVARFNAKTGLFEDVSRIYQGANPLTVVEERAEGYLKRRIQDGSLNWAEVQAWREQVEGPQADNSARTLTEWFSQSAKAWMVGEAQNDPESVPASFRAFLRALKEYFAQVLGLAKRLRELDASGKLPEGYRTHLAQAVGLERTHLEALERAADRQAATADRAAYSASEALMEIGLPTPNKESTGMGGDLRNLWESLPFGKRMRVFRGKETSLDAVAERLRVDYGFADIQTPDDVVQLAERVFVRGEEVFSRESAETTFSLAAVGEGKLIAVHNTSAEGLRYAAKLGGFPVPSVGVVKAGDLFHGFGEITLIAPPELVNPASEPVFSADAYSPRFPRAEYREVKVKDAEKVLKPVRKHFERFEELGEYGQIWDYMVNDAKPEEAMRVATKSLSMRAAFLAQGGVTVEPLKKAKHLRFEAVAQPSFQQWLKDGGDYRPSYEDTEGRKKLTVAITRAYEESVAGYDEATQAKLLDAFREQMLDPDDGLLLFGRTLPIEQSVEAFGKEQVDTYATDDALKQAMQGKEQEFAAWVESLILPVYGEPFIKSGRRKLPVTLENLTEEMKGTVRNQEKAMTFGEGATMAALSRQFSSLQEMKNSVWRLASEDQVSAERDAAKKLTNDYREAVTGYFTGRNWKGNVDTWEALDASMRALTHLPKLGSNERGMAQALRKEGFSGVPAEVVKMGVAAYNAMLNVPVPYFEGKPQRAVMIGEMVGAVIPSDAPADIRTILENAGVRVVEYSRGEGEKAAREQAVASFTEATFALAPKGRADEMVKKLKERRVSERIANADHGGNAFSPDLQARMAGRMYEVIPLQTTVDEALKVVASKGVTEVANMVTSDTAEVPRSVQVALGVGLVEHFDAQGNYAEAQRIAERVAELGTELGRAVNAFKLLGRVLDTPAKAMVFFKRQVAVAEKVMRDRMPAAEAAQGAVADVQKEAFKLFKRWIDEINGMSRLSKREALRVEDLPEVTFALSAEVKASGVVSVVARMLREGGADATEAALRERYGAAVEKSLPDLFIEAQKLNTKRSRGGKAQKKGGKASGRDSKAGEGGKGASGAQDASMGQERASLTDAEVEASLEKFREMGTEATQANLAGLEGFTELLVDKVVEAVKVKGLDTPEQVRDAVRNLFDRYGIEATPETVAKVFKEKFSLPRMTDEQAQRVSQLAQNIASTPEESAERTDATIVLLDYVNAQLREVDIVEKAWAVWYANVLSGYNTHARNLWANFLSLGTELPLAAARANPMETVLLLRELFYGVPAGVKLGAGEAVSQLRTGQTSILRAGENKFRASDALERAPFRGGNANPYNWLKVVKRLLTAEDLFAFATGQEAKARMVAWEMAKSSGLKGEALANEIERLLNNTEQQLADFNERAALEWDNLTDDLKQSRNREEWIARRVAELRISERKAELIERASDFGARVTFNYRPEGTVGVIAGMLMDGLGKVSRMEADSNSELVLKAVASSPKLIFPFIRIAANVLNRGLDYSGVGLIRASFPKKLTYTPGQGPALETKTADERDMEAKRGILGIVTMGLLSALASPDDEEAPIQIHGAGSGNRDRNQALNGPKWMPYSIEFRGAEGSRFVTFQYSPLAVGLAILGNWHDARRYKRMDEKEQMERLAVALTGAGSVILDQSFMASAADLLRLMGDSGSVSEKALYSFLGRTFNPATAVPFSNLIANVERDFDPVKRDSASIKAALIGFVPVARRWNKPALDVLGDEMENRPFDWFTKAEADGTPEARIYRMFAAKNVHPSNLWTYKGKMEPAQFYDFTKARGQYVKDTLLADGGSLIETMMGLDDEQAKEVMADISRDATAYAKQVVGYMPPAKNP